MPQKGFVDSAFLKLTEKNSSMIFGDLPPDYHKGGPHWIMQMSHSPDTGIYARPVLGSKELPSRFVGLDGYDVSKLLSPEALDLPLTMFYDLNHKLLDFPVRIGPYGAVIGESDLQLDLENWERACLETRSSVARSGYISPGFVGGTLFFKNSGERIRIYLVNHTPVTLVIEESTQKNPCAPVSVTVSTDMFCMEKGDLKISNYPEGAWKYRRFFPEMPGHTLTLGQDIWMAKGKEREISYFEIKDRAKELYGKARIDDIDDWSFPYCLAITNEFVAAEGCAGYVVPLHIDDMAHALHRDNSRFLNSRQIKQSFWNGGRSYPTNLCVTGNAGLIHLGSNNRTVFEIPLKRPPKGSSRRPEEEFNLEMKSRFRIGEPFAYVVPIPILNADQEYNGAYKTQTDISI